MQRHYNLCGYIRNFSLERKHIGLEIMFSALSVQNNAYYNYKSISCIL